MNRKDKKITNLIDDIFSAEEWEPEPEQLYPATAVRISLHICHTTGSYDSLLVKFPTLQDSVFTEEDD